MNEDIPEVGKIGPGCRLVTGRDIESPLSFKDARDGLPTHRKFDQLLHVFHVDSVSSDLRPLHQDLNLRLVALLLKGGVCRAGNAANDVQGFRAQFSQLSEVASD